MEEKLTSNIKPKPRKRKEVKAEPIKLEPVVEIKKKNDQIQPETVNTEVVQAKEKKPRITKPIFDHEAFAKNLASNVADIVEKRSSELRQHINNSLSAQDVVLKNYVTGLVSSTQFDANPIVTKLEQLEQSLESIKTPKIPIESILTQNVKPPEEFTWPLKQNLY